MPRNSDMDSDWKNRQRPCPSCRESISVLATKCRFCGEDVAKPKEEIRALSKADLGGETIVHRAPAGSVMEALEQFRAEAVAPTKGIPTPLPLDLSPVDADGLPLLNEYGRGLASVTSSFSTKTPGQKPPEEGKNARLIRIGGLIAGALVVIFLGVKGVGWVAAYFAGEEAAPPADYVNRAPEVLASGGPLLEALGAASEAISNADSDENRRIAKEVLEKIEAKIDDILNDPGWSVEKISDAATLANSTARIFSDPVALRLREETQIEANLYRMVLMPIDAASRRVRFKITAADGSRSEIGPFAEGDVIEGRMKVVRITPSSVAIEDPRRMSARGSRFREVTFETTNPTAH